MILNELQSMFERFQEEISLLNSRPEVLNLKSSYLGKKGEISNILKFLKSATIEEKKEIGPLANEIKMQIQKAISVKISDIEITEMNVNLERNRIDISYTDNIKDDGMIHGGLHPRTIITQEVENIFLSMGFEILDGPHIETEYYNFEALNTPADHPARDMQDTFWFKDESSREGHKHLLRTHTSSIQIRGMQLRKPPFRFIAPGTVYRCERTDASHEMVFQQLEGMMVGKDISVANLIYFMKETLKEIFKKEVDVRLRPGFFPFVEPGFELDIKCQVCSGKGCSVCKNVGWVELLPCGMVHPSVLRAGGIDPNIYNGFAFGIGLDRLVMMKYGIEDIRHLQSADLRFNFQFRDY